MPGTDVVASFDTRVKGLFYSLLSWQDLDDFWKRIRADAGWYVYAVGESVPAVPTNSGNVEKFIREIDALLRKEHDEDYCGIVFADDLQNPRLIKIYDPGNLGVSCGTSGTQILPGWILSLDLPTEVGKPKVIPAGRRRWWSALLGGA